DGTVTSAVNDLAAFAPQLTVLIGFPEDDTRIIDAALSSHPGLTRAQGHRWFFSDSAKDPALLTATTKPEVDGSYGTAPAQGDPANPAFTNFTDRFSSKYHVDATQYSFTSHSYDAMYLVGLAAA